MDHAACTDLNRPLCPAHFPSPPHSNTWRCTYLTGIGCTGNLESTHNEIHNILGGTQGEMA
jgi:hypothetical protein